MKRNVFSGLAALFLSISIAEANPGLSSYTSYEANRRPLPSAQKSLVAPFSVVTLFAPASATIPQSMLASLNSVLKQLQRNHQLRVVLSGYTDVVGSRNDNHTLAYQRAQAVAAYFKARGIHPGRIDLRSYGEYRAAANVNDAHAQTFDRRVDILVYTTRQAA